MQYISAIFYFFADIHSKMHFETGISAKYDGIYEFKRINHKL